MTRKQNSEKRELEFYTWRLFLRDGVYWADGRSNKPELPRVSLGTRDKATALQELRRLDRTRAVEKGLIDAEIAQTNKGDDFLTLQDGWNRYIHYVGRPTIQGGAGDTTKQRYKPVFDKFKKFAQKAGIRFWQQVNKCVLDGYNRWLVEDDYHGKTQYLELTVLKQVLNWLVREKLLPPTSNFAFPLKKPKGSTTYCYSQEEAVAIIEFCNSNPKLKWLRDVVIGLATTGLRIGELAALKWSNWDCKSGTITLRDTTRQSRKSEKSTASRTKSHRNRTLPVHADLLQVLERLTKHSDGRIFRGPSGGQITPGSVLKAFKRWVIPVMKERFPANGGDQGIDSGRIHSFRHYFCSICAQSGVPLATLMTWLGHQDSTMVMHYYHQNNQASREQMGKIPSLAGSGSGRATESQETAENTTPQRGGVGDHSNGGKD